MISEKMSEGSVPEVIYPGAPLRAVAVEVGFRPLLDAMSRFGAFQRRHLNDFNRLYETSGDDRERESLPEGREFSRPRSAVLMARDRARAVSVARNQLAVITYPYSSGFVGFMAWALPMLREGLDDLGVERITEVSYRYENRIKHDTENVDLGSILKVSLASPKEAGSTTRHLHLYWHQKWPDGTVEVDINACPSVSSEEIHLNITSHCVARSGALQDIESIAGNAHRLARLTFEGLITSRFREHLQSGGT